MNLEAFSLRDLQNVRAFLIMAKRDGRNDIEASLSMVENFVSDVRRGDRLAATRGVDKTFSSHKDGLDSSVKRRRQDTRNKIIFSKIHSFKKPCPDCGKPMKIEAKRDQGFHDAEIIFHCLSCDFSEYVGDFPRILREGVKRVFGDQYDV